MSGAIREGDWWISLRWRANKSRGGAAVIITGLDFTTEGSDILKVRTELFFPGGAHHFVIILRAVNCGSTQN